MGRPRKFPKEKILQLYIDGKNQSQIANEIGCSQGYVRRLLSDNNLIDRRRKGQNPDGIKNAQKIIDHIMTNGGSIRAAILLLDLDVCSTTVRKLAAELGIDIYSYRYIATKRRNWLVHKPGYEITATSTRILPVQCTHCGYETTFPYWRFQKAHPMVCPKCGIN